MLTKRFNKVGNKGFTLIEILLAITLLAVATVAIGSVIISTQNNTAGMFNEAELQQQLAEAQETLHNQILGTTSGMKFWTRDSDTDSFGLVLKDDGGEYEKIIAFYSLDTIDPILKKVYYRYNSKDKTLELAEIEQDVSDAIESNGYLSVDENIESVLNEIGEKWTLVANNMEIFSIDMTHYGNKRLISFDMEIKHEDVSYPTNDTIYMRNAITINESMKIDRPLGPSGAT